MTWAVYPVVFKLKSPLHIGCGKVGNVQRTRPYVIGRVFWGALTLRLTRDATDGAATDSPQYKNFGKKVNQQLAFTYFYPAIQSNNDYKIEWPWENESLFRRRFLSSYVSTALVYPQQAAKEGSLHEVEFISPRTLDKGEQVYLVGYVFEKEGCDLNWKCACKRLQLGGERGYGWGDVKCLEITEMPINKPLFYNSYSWQEENNSILIKTSENSHLLAHTKTTHNSNTLSAQGEIEPLVGREWKAANQAGESVDYSGICWTPGTMVNQSYTFTIEKFGIWQLSR